MIKTAWRCKKMGGCYGNYSSNDSYRTPVLADWEKELSSFAKRHKLEDLISAYKGFFADGNKSGFFAQLAKAAGIKKVEDIPKEYNGIEYEVKFDIEPVGEGKEPGVEQYLDAFDFPVGVNTKVARYIKDPVNTNATGVNHFFGGLDEKLVVIEKMGKIYLKEKGSVEQVGYGIPGEQLVVKRTEDRYEAGLENVMNKVNLAIATGDDYRGRIRKEKGDAFVLDTTDGRIYSMSFTRAHLVKPGENEEGAIQRQMEFEYAGYIPGFRGFVQDSEPQIVKGMVDLAKYVYKMYGFDSENAVVADGWTMRIRPTTERKFDFIVSGGNQALEELPAPLRLEMPAPIESKSR
jgi:hypothetical protein